MRCVGNNLHLFRYGPHAEFQVDARARTGIEVERLAGYTFEPRGFGLEFITSGGKEGELVVAFLIGDRGAPLWSVATPAMEPPPIWPKAVRMKSKLRLSAETMCFMGCQSVFYPNPLRTQSTRPAAPFNCCR